MSVFGDYAKYYDLFYRDKDYAGEVALVHGLIRKHSPKAHTLLELGCGTARHALELVRRGYSVTGVDLSAGMVARGKRAAARLPAKLRGRLNIVQGDVANFRATWIYDSAISLFHVVSYQITNAALAGMFRSARKAIYDGGVFIFDFWYGPAVLTDRPAIRIKRAATSTVRVTRLAEPVLHANRNVVDVNYTLLIKHLPSGRMKDFKETHRMRYLFLPEIESLATETGFKIVETGEWLTRRPLDDCTWLGYVVARAV